MGTITVYPRLAATAACSISLVSASSGVQGDRSAASVLSLLKTTDSCLVDTTSPWSVPIVVSCSARLRKSSSLFSSTLKKAVQSPGILVSSLTRLRIPFPLLLRVESLRLPGRYLSHTTSTLSNSLTGLLRMEGRRSYCTLEMSWRIQA